MRSALSVVKDQSLTDLIEQVGATTQQLRKFPSIAGTDTSRRSVVADANTVARAWNDVALAPDATLSTD